MSMSEKVEEIGRIFQLYERKRSDIGDCLFSSQRFVHRISNARKLVKLAGELAELAALLERK
jgi:ABC-type uncharacterized transport system fused permease/ATPase subunit